MAFGPTRIACSSSQPMECAETLCRAATRSGSYRGVSYILISERMHKIKRSISIADGSR